MVLIFFSKFDLSLAYFQVPLTPESRPYTAFRIRQYQYQFTRLPYGMVSAVSVFIAMMNSMFPIETRNWLSIYVDDLCCFSATFEEHLLHIERVLQTLKQHGLTVKLSKCNFALKEIQFLGHQISGQYIKPCTNNHEAIRNFPRPNNKKALQRWLGLCNWHHKYIDRYSTIIVEPLYQLLRKI